MVAAICGILVAGPVRAAGDGCEDEKNDRITPELALCSVHAYNIGSSSNPTGADKQLMKEIIALKTTVITQQMNKQYEYMEAMIRRFKTQLEKAVLTTKLQAAKIASSTGVDMVIANSKDIKVIHRILSGQNIGTLFLAHKDEEFDLPLYVQQMHAH